jgi:hypothetical protein
MNEMDEKIKNKNVSNFLGKKGLRTTLDKGSKSKVQ